MYMSIMTHSTSLCTEFRSLSGIELNEERGINGDSDFTIRGRLMSLVEKVAYLKKRMANLPKEKADKKPSKSFITTFYYYIHLPLLKSCFSSFSLITECCFSFCCFTLAKSNLWCFFFNASSSSENITRITTNIQI